MTQDTLIDLSGLWKVRRLNSSRTLRGRVPGLIHHDLIAQGLLPDPFFRRNEIDQQDIGSSGWEYTRSFRLSAGQARRRSILLDCEGLDTIAEIFVNGKSVAKTDNMFLRHRIDIKPFVRTGSNTIRIVFHPAAPEMKKRAQAYTHALGGFRHAPWEPENRNFLRKSHTHGGWDWGPCFLTQGPYRPVHIDCRDSARILSLTHRQEHADNGKKVRVRVTARIESASTLYAKAAFRLGGIRTRQTVSLKPGLNIIEEDFLLKNPSLWWPNGEGSQTLHELSCSVSCGNETDAATQRIGLRSVELVRRPDKWGESFFFRVNGRPLYAKGADWIPGDSFDSRLTDDRIRQDLSSAADAHCNMIRVWGGGLYERDFFYEECDRLGLLLWQDFMFACHLYPTTPAFLDSVKEEVRYQIRRLQHHPSVALWCGNNENEQAIAWHSKEDREDLRALLIAEYDQLYVQTIAPIVAEEDPDRTYWPSSPSNGLRKYGEPNDLSRGDVHFWEVWHGDKPYEHFESVIPRFCSEFGFQSFPAAETMDLCTLPEDRNLTSPVAEHHQRSGQGNQRIIRHISLHFRMPVSWTKTLYLSQVHQAEAIRRAVEHWRRNKPRNMGVIVWQLNDIWPVASWSSLDYLGRWKILHYAEKRAFAPLLVSSRYQDGQATLWAVSDRNNPEKGTLRIALRDFSGKKLWRMTKQIRLKPFESRIVHSFQPERICPKIRDWKENFFLEITLSCGGEKIRNTLFFAEYKHLQLREPGMRVRLDAKGHLTLSCRYPAFFVTANTGQAEGSWTDNGFVLMPDEPRKILFRPWPAGDKKALVKLRKSLSVSDLYSSFTETPPAGAKT